MASLGSTDYYQIIKLKKKSIVSSLYIMHYQSATLEDCHTTKSGYIKRIRWQHCSGQELLVKIRSGEFPNFFR